MRKSIRLKRLEQKISEMWNCLDGMTDDELDKLKSEIERLNTTNCWFALHTAKPLLMEIATCCKGQ